MKISKDENGKLIIDGLSNTILYPKDGELWMDVDDGIEVGSICNFNVIYPTKRKSFWERIFGNKR